MALFFEDVLALMRDAGVRHVIVGGTAVILHGVPRTTADLDLVVDHDPANMRRLVSVMTRPRAPVDAAGLSQPDVRRTWIEDKGMRAFTFCLPEQPLSEIDILIDSPITYEELSRQADRIDVGGLVLFVASIQHLIQMKLAAARAQDIADADALKRLLEEQQHG